MPTIDTSQQTLSEEEVDNLARSLCEGGYHSELLFQSKFNRDAVYRAAKASGASLRRRSTGHSLLDPRYTVEGSEMPDKGLGNDYDHSFGNLYVLERTL